MHALEKFRGLVIWDWYFRRRMEMISTQKKGNERKECGNNINENLYWVYVRNFKMLIIFSRAYTIFDFYLILELFRTN